MKQRQSLPYMTFMLALSVYAVAALVLSAFSALSADTRAVLDYADTAVCAFFLLDFLITLIRAENRAAYLLRWGWLDLLSSIPAVDTLRWGRVARIVRIVRVVRGVKAGKVVTEFLLERRAQSAFLAVLLLSLLLIVLTSAAILQFETSPDANIRTPEDALWWAVVTVTTVGYGDRFPLSSEGRVIAALLMTAGVGLFGTFSGFVAAWFLAVPKPEPREDTRRSEIEELRHEVKEIRDLLTTGGRERGS